MGIISVLMGVQTPAPPIFSYTYTGYQPIGIAWMMWFYDKVVRIMIIRFLFLIRFWAEVLLNYAGAESGAWSLTDAGLGNRCFTGRAGITAGGSGQPESTKADPTCKRNYFPEITRSPALAGDPS